MGVDMLKKIYSKEGNTCEVTFILPKEVNANTVYLCGDFNNWDNTANPMKYSDKDGFITTIILNVGKSYRFRYFIDESRWENDWQADSYCPNEFGGEDSVVEL
jgi:1,4-alpha-glucan branching enzyme